MATNSTKAFYNSEVHRVKKKWVIENFSSNMIAKKDLFSAPFPEKDSDNQHWRLKLNINPIQKDVLVLTFHLFQCTNECVRVRKPLFFATFLEVRDSGQQVIATFPLSNPTVKSGCSLTLSFDHAKKKLNLQKLIVLCQVSQYVSVPLTVPLSIDNMKDRSVSSKKDAEVQTELSSSDDSTISASKLCTEENWNTAKLSHFTGIFFKLYEDKIFFDVALITSKRIFRCHKCLLATVSDVFRRMFEDATNTLPAIDLSMQFDAKTVEDFVNFIYTEETPNISETALKLLEFAEHFQIKSLRSRCEKFLLENLSTENAHALYYKARSCNATLLKEKALELLLLKM